METAAPWFNELCTQHGLAAEADAMSALLRPSLAFAPTSADTVALGTSRKGGGPDVPDGFVWPVHRGRALDFLLQINLADLPGTPTGLDLPATGVLSFFYDAHEQPWGYEPEHRTGHRVFLFDADTLLERRPPPDEALALVPSALSFEPGLRLPHRESAEGERVGTWMAQHGLDWDEHREEAYFELTAAVAAHHAGAGQPLHALGGPAHNVQGDMQMEAQLVTHGLSCGDGTAYKDPRRPALEREREQWQLLLQLDSADDDAMWGDSGMLYFWVRRQDLAARDLSQTWVALQSC